MLKKIIFGAVVVALTSGSALAQTSAAAGGIKRTRCRT
jgi:hypothetical protein